MTVAMSDVTSDEAGLASGVVNTSAHVGGALGLAVLATLSGAEAARLSSLGVPADEALTSGFHLAFVIGAGLVLLALVLTAVVLRPADGRGGDSHAPAAFG